MPACRDCGRAALIRILLPPVQVRRLLDSLVYVMKQVNIDGMNRREQADAIKEVREPFVAVMPWLLFVPTVHDVIFWL